MKSPRKQGRVKNAQPTVVDGIRFHSKREARRWGELLLLQKAGEITDLERQYSVPLIGHKDVLRTPTGRQMKYVADFRYWDVDLEAFVIEDSKGHETDTFKMKRAILAAMGVEILTT